MSVAKGTEMKAKTDTGTGKTVWAGARRGAVAAGTAAFAATAWAAALPSRGAETTALAVPPPGHADGETCAHMAIPPLEKMNFFKITMAFHATPSNSLTAAVGTDADGDGRLSLREQAVEFGWDGGAWFIRRQTPSAWWERERLEWAGGGAGPRQFEAVRWLRSADPDFRLCLSAGGMPLASWDGPDAWLPQEALHGGLVRVTARGEGVEGLAVLTAGAEGTILNIR